MTTKVFNNNEELLALVKENEAGKYIDFEGVSIVCRFNIDLENISILNALNINAWNINALDINAGNITAENIDAWNIDAWNINARNIDARNIDAGNIDARNIDAGDILYYAVCFAYQNIKCVSIKANRRNARHFCLDGEIIIKKEEPKETIKIGDCVYDKQEVEKALKNVKSLRGEI